MKFFERFSGLLDAAGDLPVAGFTRRLIAGFAPLGKAGRDVPKRAALYVVTGGGSDVLLELRNPALGSNPLRVGIAKFSYTRPEGAHLTGLLAVLRDDAFVEPERLVRLGMVLADATGKPLDDGCFPGSERCPDWFRAVMTTAAASHVVLEPKPRTGDHGAVTLERALAALASAGAEAEALLDYAFTRVRHYSSPLVDASLPGFDRYLAEHPAEVAKAARALDAEGRVALCTALRKAGAIGPNLPALAELALQPSKRVREAAKLALHGTEPEALASAVAPVFAGKSTESKRRAVELLASALGAAAVPFLRAQLDDRTPKPLADAIALQLAAFASTTEDAEPEHAEPMDAAEEHAESEHAEPKHAEPEHAEPKDAESEADTGPGRGAGSSAYVAIGGSVIEIPPAPPAPTETPFPPDLRAELCNAIERFNADQQARHDENPQLYRARRYSHAIADRFIDVAEGRPTDPDRALGPFDAFHQGWSSTKMLGEILADPRVTIRHLLRLYQVFARARGSRPLPSAMYASFDEPIAAELLRRIGALGDLRAAVGLHDVVGMEADRFARIVFLQWSWAEAEASQSPVMWPFVIGRLSQLEEGLGVRAAPEGWPAPSVEHVLGALRLLPATPQSLVAPLMRVAVTGSRAQRRAARDLLEGARGLDGSIAALLADGKLEVRADAALWLAERGARAFVAHVRRALERERSDRGRAAFMRALVALGDDISPYAGEATLLAEAKRGLAKTSAKGLEWFPFDLLPALHWAGGEPVAPAIVRWWVVLANKLEEPGGNPLFEFYFDRLEPGDAAALGAMVLALFVERDSEHPPEADAIAYAEARADGQLAALRGYFKDLTRASVYAGLKADYLSQYVHSSAENRGVLALATRAPGPDAAATVRDFLERHGSRTSQAKALLACLAANPSPAAIAVVLAAANRSKQRTVQEHAAGLVQSVADARGWTPDRLADNTVPSAGLDENGILELDAGAAGTVVAVLGSDGKLEVRGAAAATARPEVKRALAAAKKEIKQVFESQSVRLFEAMCAERTWPADEWERLLLRHPIVGRLCVRLVWLALDAAGATVASFRPLDDGTLSSVEYERIELAGVAAVKLAHRAICESELSDAWTAHFAEYEVAPLFSQFARPLLVPPRGAERAGAVTDRIGWMIDTRKLQAAAVKRGYQRGSTENGGFFVEYVRRCGPARLEAVIGFTGAHAAEAGGTAALTELTFRTAGRGTFGVAPAKVPPVLLSESWNDLHEIAAAGTGFDPEWEKKVQF